MKPKSKTYTREDFQEWGAMGHKLRKRNRTLTHAQSMAMVEIRRKNKARRLREAKAVQHHLHD